MSSGTVERTPVQQPQRFPFGPEFQASLFRLLVEDGGFAHALTPYLEPGYFEAEPLAWAWSFFQRYQETYGSTPSLRVILEQTRGLDSRVRPLYTATMEEVGRASLREEAWLRDRVLDFVKRNIFVRAFADGRSLYNAGKVSEAYDLMMERMEKLQTTSWERVDRGWLFDDLAARQSARLGGQGLSDKVTTGWGWLDYLMGGGLAIGEMGLWMAYAKGGKSTALIQHGVAATRLAWRNTLHFVLEGTRRQVETRYDAAFTEELYRHVQTGDIDDDRYQRMVSEYRMLKGKLVIRGMTERWDYTVLDLDAEIQALKREHAWSPTVVIVDYGDLINGRGKNYRNPTEQQTAGYKDLRTLAGRGYALWTASQAQRPAKGSEVKPHFLRSDSIADAYSKVRVADFIGSLNQTLQEKDARMVRVLAELYRDAEAGQWMVMEADFARMLMREKPGLVSPSMPTVASDTRLGSLPVQQEVPV